MPTLPFPAEFFGAGLAGLGRDHVVILHPDDFNTLRMVVQREGWDPSFAVRPTIHGARVVTAASHPRGFATILDAWTPSHFNEQYREALRAHLGSSELVPSADDPEPRSLWERLDEDE